MNYKKKTLFIWYNTILLKFRQEKTKMVSLNYLIFINLFIFDFINLPLSLNSIE